MKMKLSRIRKPIVTFLGPSYPRFLAQKILDADYRPPARRGDLIRAVKDGAQTIILIDGYLVYDYPPSPMEVHEVIARGVTVIGTASLGALRAVELKQCGMFGSGWVYERYLDLSIDSDDEVVTSLNARTDEGVTLPLVRIRYAVSQLVVDGKLSKAQGKFLINYLRNIYFEKRTKTSVQIAAQQCSISTDITESLFSKEFDIKAIDTLDCLHYIAKNTKKNTKTLGDHPR
jgi:TfuA protein